MPALQLLVPCTNAIIDSRTNSMSLINILTGLRVSTTTEGVPVLDSELHVVTVWRTLQGEEGSTCHQRLAVLAADGTKIGNVENPFTLEKTYHRVINRLVGLPLPLPGPITFQLHVRKDSEPEFRVVAEYVVVLQAAPGD